MSSLATDRWMDAPPSSPAPRVDDDELGQRIALALRERRPTLDFEPLLGGRYLVEGRVSVDEHVERYDASRVSDGRWVTVERPLEGADQNAHERFIRSARQQCRLRHPHAMYALEHGVGSDGRPFLVREALDTESLATMLTREGSVTWARARSIALQLCNAVSAARDLDLVPADLSLEGCRRARHGRAIDDIRLTDWILIDGLTPEERDERAAVFAIGRIVEELVAGYGPDGGAGTNPHVVPPPPAELGSVLARARSLVPTARHATVEQLGIAIAAIGDDFVARTPPVSRDDTSYAVIVPPPRRRSRPIEHPVEITCSTADVLTTPAVEIAASVVQPEAPTRRVLWPWIGLAAIVGVCAVHIAAPQFWPGVADQARSGIDSLRDTLRGREPHEVPAAPVAAAAIGVPEPATPLAEAREPSPPVVSIEAIPTASGVIARSAAVPPAPKLVAPSPRSPAKARTKPRAPSRAVAVLEGEVISAPIDRTASPVVDATPVATPVSTSPEVPVTMPTIPTPPANDPPTDTPPRQEPPSSTPPVGEPPREIDDPDAPPPSIEGDDTK